MSRITITLGVGVILFMILSGLFGIIAVNDEFVNMINEIPLFRPFVEFLEELTNMETGNPFSNPNVVKDILSIMLLSIFMIIIKKMVDVFIDAYAAETPFDKVASFLNKIVWNFIFSMGSVLFVSATVSNIYNYTIENTNEVWALSISLIIIAVILFVTTMWQLYIRRQKAGIMLTYIFLIPAIKIILMSAIYACIFVSIKLKLYIFIGIAVGLTIICFVIEGLRGAFLDHIKKTGEK